MFLRPVLRTTSLIHSHSKYGSIAGEIHTPRNYQTYANYKAIRIIHGSSLKSDTTAIRKT